MNVSVSKVTAKPTAAPATFQVFEVKDEGQFVFCPVRGKAYKVDSKPEEVVRQWWLYRLKEVYGYGFDQMDVEVKVIVGAAEAKKRADIVVYRDAKKQAPRIFVEVKKANRRDGVDQLQVYMSATGCRLGLWSNGDPPHVYLLRMEPSASGEEPTWRELRNIPSKTEKLEDVDSPITRAELLPVSDFLALLRECEDYIKAHEGVDPFDELFKLIFIKLYDERANLKNETSSAQFRVGVFESPDDVRGRISDLFEKAKARWSGVFGEGETLELGNDTLAFCVSAFQKAYLLKSDADILGSAFEVMINPGMKGDKGQYFTPRHVIDMAIDVLDPNDGETVFDPACGSGGFLIGAMDRVFAKIESERDDTNEALENKKDYASECVFGIDYDRRIAKVAKAYMLIWGDGRSNIMVADALNQDHWDSSTKAKFTHGSGKVATMRIFDVIATNPPFAGDISADDTLSRYEVAYKPTKGGGRRRLAKVSRDKLFLERCITMLRPGGRLAIVLPRGILKNYTDEYVRRYVLVQARVVAVVALGSTMFKPFTNTKTCVLFLQKRDEPLAAIADVENDPPTIYAVSEQSGKDRSGTLIRDSDGQVQSDLGEITSFIKNEAIWN